jgi:hypothetical protein
MVERKIRFEDTCQITSVKNEVSVLGEILTFQEKDLIIATINRSAKVTLRWKDHAQSYVVYCGSDTASW